MGIAEEPSKRLTRNDIPIWSGAWWLLWLGVFFLPVELYAAKSEAVGDTFSEFAWDVFGVRRERAFGPLRRLILTSFLLALGSHLRFGTTVLPVAILAFPLGGIIVYWAVRERGRPYEPPKESFMFKKIWPALKTVALPVLSTAASLAAGGAFGPKAAAAAAAISTLVGLFSKRPQDHKEDAPAN